MESNLNHFFYKIVNKITGKVICVSDCFFYDEDQFYKNHPASFRNEYVIISKEEYDRLKEQNM